MKPSQISDTATFIAIKFYGLTKDDKFSAMFEEEVILFYERLISSLPYPYRLYEKALDYGWLRHFFVFWEELLLPGDLMHIIMRKWHLQKIVEKLKEKGFSQLIVLGAGFDHLATLQSQNGMKAIEFDAHRMASIKQHFITKHHYANDNLHIIPLFFSRENESQSFLHHKAIDASKPTIVVAEGFFDYLTKNQCSHQLKYISTFFKAPVYLISTIFSLQELSPFRSFVYDKSIRLEGEKLKLNMNTEEFISLLEKNDFSVEQKISYHKMQQTLLKPKHINLPVLPGFYILKAKLK